MHIILATGVRLARRLNALLARAEESYSEQLRLNSEISDVGREVLNKNYHLLMEHFYFDMIDRILLELVARKYLSSREVKRLLALTHEYPNFTSAANREVLERQLWFLLSKATTVGRVITLCNVFVMYENSFASRLLKQVLGD